MRRNTSGGYSAASHAVKSPSVSLILKTRRAKKRERERERASYII